MSAVWSKRDSALGLSILLEDSMRPVGVLLLPHDTDLSQFMIFGPAAVSKELNYRSCCCKQAFMALTWSKWEDMSVDSTISTTSERSSLCTKRQVVKSVTLDYGNALCGVKGRMGLDPF